MKSENETGKRVERIDDKDNLIRLMQEYKDLVFSICLRLTGDYFIAEDITQETFLAAYQHFEQFDGQNEKAWICRIAGNRCIDWQRKQKREEIVTASEEMPEPSADTKKEPLNQVLGREVMERLMDSIDDLPELYRETARYYFIENCTAAEISEKTGISLKTVQSRIARAREMLKKSIRKEDLLTG